VIPLRAQFVSHLKSRGEEILTPELIAKKQYLIIEDVLAFKRKQEELIRKVFTEKEDFDRFKLALKEAFEYFLNKNSNQTSEFLAKFLDYHLRKNTGSVAMQSGSAGKNHLEILTEEVIQVFKYIKSKDVFEEFYARGLCVDCCLRSRPVLRAKGS
jgi:hypothetical protein